MWGVECGLYVCESERANVSGWVGGWVGIIYTYKYMNVLCCGMSSTWHLMTVSRK